MDLYSFDDLRNQLLACQQQSMAHDQARLDAEQSARESAAAERVAVDRLRAVESDAEKHRCPPDVRGRVRELTAEIKALQTQAASLRVALGRSDKAAARLQTEIDALFGIEVTE